MGRDAKDNEQWASLLVIMESITMSLSIFSYRVRVTR
jgi:hypothetical protein